LSLEAVSVVSGALMSIIHYHPIRIIIDSVNQWFERWLFGIECN